MSSTSITFTSTTSATSSTSSPSPASTISSSTNNDNPSSFYKNLFYILIGLLCAFGIVSFLSLMRARRRRNAIFREAERLGLLVPGMDGYIPLRERAALGWTKADGSQLPDWWEVGDKRWGGDNNGDHPLAAGGGCSEKIVPLGELDDTSGNFHPLALIPPPPPVQDDSTKHKPISDVPFFPNHLAYLPESLTPAPTRFNKTEPKTLEQLAGDKIEVLTIIKMPVPDHRADVEEGEEVIREWGGMELGMMRICIDGQGGNGNGNDGKVV